VRLTSGRALSAVLLAVIAMVTLSALFGEHGIPHLLALRAERQTLGQTAFTLFQENERLREQITRLKTDDLYVEGLARKQLGLVRPNEIVYRFRAARGDGR
jgi:cell division protein FtsB